MKPLWKFAQHGQCGRWASDLFPEVNRHVDDLCFIHSLHTEGVAHGPATLFLHCGSTNFIRPSMGSWVLYGLGTENANLPGFVTHRPSAGNGGPRNYGNAFLPAVYQGTALGKAGGPASEATIRNLTNPRLSSAAQRRQFDLLQQLNAEQLKKDPGDSELEAVVNSYRTGLAHAGQRPGRARPRRRIAGNAGAVRHRREGDRQLRPAVPDGPPAVRGRACATCRSPTATTRANPAWDQHSNLPQHADHARAVDRPIAGLLADLKRRGLLEDTLVWWGGEFGRTPYAEKNGTGRDHNPDGFTVWLAGGGVKPGFAYGPTDEFGHLAVEDKVHMHDLHATILHLLGLDHERLTYRYNGRHFRLTDVQRPGGQGHPGVSCDQGSRTESIIIPAGKKITR